MSHYSSELLSAFLDGDLAPRQQTEVDSHLAACDECRRKLDELRTLVDTLRSLPDEPPQRTLWAGIRVGLEPRDIPRMRYGRLAAVAAILLIVAAGGWFVQRPTDRAETLKTARVQGYLEAIDDMEEVLDGLESVLDPASMGLVRREIGILDNAIDEVQQALAEDPDNDWLEDSLARALRSKWTYLREAPDLAPRRIAGG